MLFQNIKWQKYGLVIKPNKKLWWMQSHAMLPTPYHIQDSLYRIYFAGRDQENKSHIGYAVIDMKEPDKVLEMSTDPVLTPGRLGTFDDNGVLASCLVPTDSETFLYIIGFKPGGTTRMDLFGGLAIGDQAAEKFQHWSEAPIIGRNRVNPFINTAPWVLKEENGYRMYYVAGVEWIHKDLPRYNIQTATSEDGKNWHREGKVVIDFVGDENALARPYVIKKNNKYHMLFSAKGDVYHPYTAESNDGLHWERSDEPLQIKRGGTGEPDEEMICYPIVLEHGGRHIMYYNGNGYGQNGVCLAVEAD